MKPQEKINKKISPVDVNNDDLMIAYSLRLPRLRVITGENWKKSAQEKDELSKMKGVAIEPATNNPAPKFNTGIKHKLTIYMKNGNKSTVTVYCFAQEVIDIVSMYKNNKCFITAIDYNGKRYAYNKLHTIPMLKKNMRSK